ncbi:MAG TPA: GNAT family N-acetyltransferase [Gemmatimonadales bacterium]|nr:GNAT family N-acetyltransferase [Gemmatimonadales bacterium]
MNERIAFRVRPAAPHDAPLLSKHRVEMFRDMGQLADDDTAAALRSATEPMIGEWIAAGTYVGWLAEPLTRPGLVVGGAGIQLRPMLPRPGRDGPGVLSGPEAYVLNVFVERAWRRRGVAAQLMEQALAYVRERRLRVVTLHASDDGRSLYEKLGFAGTNEMRLR